MEQKTVTMKKTKDTATTRVYQETSPGGAVRVVYVNNGTWTPMPEEIVLTVTPKA